VGRKDIVDTKGKKKASRGRITIKGVPREKQEAVKKKGRHFFQKKRRLSEEDSALPS